MVDLRAGDGANQFGQIGLVGAININSRRTLSCIPFQAPPLPCHFVDRPEISQDLKQRILTDSNHHSGTLVISAIQGLGGIGKTILAQALAHDSQVRERFGDGILWASLGQQPDVLSLLQGWIVALKDYDYKPTNVQAASNHLNSLLYDKAVLLVIDDGWKVEDIQPFRVGSGKCQVIITTRRADVAEEVNAQLYSLHLMSEEQSLMLLSKRLGKGLEEDEKESAKKLASAVGYLPIALDLAAARIAGGKPWSELNSALTSEIARLEVLEGVRRRSRNETRLEACFNLSLNVLREDFPEAWDSFVWLGVLPEDISIAAPMVATLWKIDVTEAADRLELFWNDALLLPGVPARIGAKEWQTYRIHDLLHDLAINWLTNQNSPGLGLTIPQVHSILLERYQNQLNNGRWHKLADDGYIHEHLTWHMEKAECADSIHQLLREETESGQNGWYVACDSLGKTAIFVGDVARAWKLAESEFDSNPTRAIGLQCRYCLITSSLNTIAGNIPPELISALVEKKVWTPAQGLAYSRQVQSLDQRVKALSQLASYFPDIWSEALEAARNIDFAPDRAEALSFLVPHLPEIWSEALEAARNIGNEYCRARVLSFLVPHLPEIWSEALEAARNIEDEYDRARVLSFLVPHLPEIWSEALEAARNIEDEPWRTEVLSFLVPHLPEIWSEALEAARNIEDESWRARVLSSLAPHLSENLVLEVLESARNIGDEYERAEALSFLVPHLPEIWSEALEATRNIGDESKRARVLSFLAPHLPKNLVLEVLESARNIGDEYDRACVLSFLVPHLPEIRSEALEAARNISSEYLRAYVLSFLVPHLPEIRSEVLEAARNIEFEYFRSEVLRSLAPHLPKNLVLEVLESARNIGDEYDRACVLSFLVPHLPEIRSEALEAVRNMGDGYERARVLSSLAPHLPAIWSEALEAARNIGDESKRARVLSSLAPHLPEIWSEALEVARNIGSESERAEVLSDLAPNVHKMFDSFPYDFWCELIHSLASLKRGELLGKISNNSHIIKELSSSLTFREIADAITDVGRWFP